MKKILLLLLLIPYLLSAQNRLATANDTAAYHAKVNDLIIDTPTKTFSDGVNQVRYTNISSTFPGFREGGTIWMDGSRLGSLCEIRFLNGNETNPWHINEATFRPVPGTRIDGKITSNSYGGFLYLIQGLKKLHFFGSSPKYPGLVGVKKGVFLKGRFGFGATTNGYYDGYHLYSFSVLDGGGIEMEGFEGEHGFSIVRINGGNYNSTVTLSLTNFYIHDSGSELKYIGATHAEPYSKIKDLTITNGVLARSGAESLQFQHLVGNAHIYNLTVFAADAMYLNEFQPGQDTNIQMSPDAGNSLIENLVLDGSGSHTINCFGAPFDAAEKNTTFKNILINNPRGEAIYFHNSSKYGMNWKFENIYIRKPNREYYIDNKITAPNWLISTMNGTDRAVFDTLYHDGTYSNVFQNTGTVTEGTTILQELPDIEYVNSGFHESANRIKNYSRYRAEYLSGKPNVAVTYEVDDVVIDRETGYVPVILKCIKKNTATELRPKNDTVNYMRLTWDDKTVRCDQPGWNSSSSQMGYPPDDLRIAFYNYYALKNMGYIERMPNMNFCMELISILSKALRDKNKEIDTLNKQIDSMLADIRLYLEKYE